MPRARVEPSSARPTAGATGDELARVVGAKEVRKVRARRRGRRTLLFGMGMFGLVGWSLTVPTLAGLALGLWLDRRVGGRSSWTVTLLLAGLVAGCFNAWFWIERERRGG